MLIRKCLILLSLTVFYSHLGAEPRLNEISSATWERAVRTDPSGGGDRLGAGAAWFESNFAGPGWVDGGLPFSFDSGPQDDDLTNRMKWVTPTLYLRHEFQVTAAEASSSADLVIDIRARDGYLIFLNGVEVARADLGAPGSWVFHDQPAHFSRSINTDLINLGPASAILQSGTNMLAVLHSNDSVLGEYFYNGHQPSPADIYFKMEMEIGNDDIDLDANPWSYFVGLTEPSGGLLDLADPADGFVDWIELFNPGAAAFDLTGWSLTDSSSNLQKWTFPAGTEIAAGGYLVIACSGKDIATPAAGGLMHTNFSLDDRGEFVALVRPDGSVAGQFDNVPDQDAQFTWGIPAVGGAAVFLDSTPGTANSAEHASGRCAKPQPVQESGRFASSLPTVTMDGAPAVGSTVHYTLDGSVPDANDPVFPAAGLDLESLTPSLPAGRGHSLREVWGPLGPGTYLDSLPLPTPPDVIKLVPGAEATSRGTQRFGERLSGMIVAPVTGNYRFYLAADYESRMLLSSDSSTANLVEIIDLPSPVPSRVWDADNDQRSALISLQAGQSYAFEAYNFGYGYGSHLSIGWLPPGASEPAHLPAEVIAQPTTLPPGVAAPSAPRVATLRVRALGSGMLPSKVTTRSYSTGLTPEQNALPSVFLSGDADDVFYGPNGIYGVEGGSMVEDPYNSEDLVWQPDDKRTDHSMALGFGRAFERPGVFEVVLPDGSLAGRTTAGLRFSGSAFSRPHYQLEGIDGPLPWIMDWRSKPQMNIFFRGPLGEKTFGSDALLPASTIDDWNSLRLRAGRSGDNITLTYDEMVRRMFADLGQPSVTGRPSNVFINGELRGLFLLLERPREDWLRTFYDTSNNFTMRVHDTVESGDPDDIDDMFDIVKATDCSTPSGYATLAGLWDLENVADYAILNSYIASGDFIYPSSDQNFVMFRDDSPGGKWRFTVWDAESSFGSEQHDVNTDWTSQVLLDDSLSFSAEESIIRTVFRRAYQNPEFHLLFADRVQRAFGAGGPFTNAQLTSTLAEVNAPLAAAQCAWVGSEPDTTDATDWIAARGSIQLSQWQALGLWPSIAAPAATPNGGSLAAGGTVSLTNPNGSGTVYFTTDTSDPREIGGTVAPTASAYSTPFAMPTGGKLLARVLTGGVWSPLLETDFAPPLPQLAITELHYNPDGSGDATEFLEIRNLGTITATLDGAQFIDGIDFTFGPTSLAPGERLILVKDSSAFAIGYPGVTFAGEYAGGLSNGGEILELVDAVGNQLILLEYGDDKIPGWPALADGKGRSLVRSDEDTWPVATGAAAWRDSFDQPTPGGSEMLTFSGDPDADADGDDLPALVEYAIGSDDLDPNDQGHFVVTTNTDPAGRQAIVELRHDLRASDTELELLFSIDNENWQVLTPSSDQDEGNGFSLRTYQCPPGLRGFVKLRATSQ